MVLPVVMYGCESWTIKKAEHQRIDTFELWCWISLQYKGLSRVFSNTTVKSINSSAFIFFMVQFLYPYTTLEKLQLWLDRHLSVRSMLLNKLSRLVITFLPRSKRLLISWLQSPSADFGAQENIVCHCFHCFPIYLPWSDGTRWHFLSFLNVEF